MATTLFQGTPVALAGEFIQKGVQAPDFSLVKGDLSTFSLADAKGKFVVLNIFPSMDTGVCAASVRKFNKLAAGMENTLVLAISKDLPFAQGRFCTAEGIEHVIPLSDFRYTSRYTVIMVTHNMQQAVRVSDKTAFFLLGELVEFGDTERVFSHPQEKRTEDYITGRFG